MVTALRIRSVGSLGVEKYGLEDKLTEFDGYLGREIGYVLSKDYWGGGIMPEAVRTVINHLFGDLNLDFLICGYYDFNNQSKRVQEKCGFKPYRKLVMDTRMGTKDSSKPETKAERSARESFFFKSNCHKASNPIQQATERSVMTSARNPNT